MSSSPSQTVGIETPDGTMPAQLWLPPAGTGAGVVVYQEIFGVGRYIRSRCADLAALGYVVLAPEFYWRIGRSSTPEEGPDILDQAMGAAGQLDWDAAVDDGIAALEHLRGRIEITGDVGVLGFCWGGGLAFDVAVRDDPDALVSYYGSSLPGRHHQAGLVSAPSLYHFGLADQFIPPDTVADIAASVGAQPDVLVETYEGAGHAFDNPNPLFHHPGASAAAWASTVRFLSQRLRLTADAPRE